MLLNTMTLALAAAALLVAGFSTLRRTARLNAREVRVHLRGVPVPRARRR